MTRIRSKLSSKPSTKTVVTVLLIVSLAPFAVFAVPQVVGAEQSYVVISSSMSPAINANDAVIVDDVSPNTIQEGDVIVFHDDQTAENSEETNVVTHRVTEVREEDGGTAFQTKGDANEDPDSSTVPASAVVGQVGFTIPYIGHLISFASSQTGFILLVGVPLTLLVLGEIYDFVVAARQTQNQSPDPNLGEE